LLCIRHFLKVVSKCKRKACFLNYMIKFSRLPVNKNQAAQVYPVHEFNA
jgi:hypothetical protein